MEVGIGFEIAEAVVAATVAVVGERAVAMAAQVVAAATMAAEAAAGNSTSSCSGSYRHHRSRSCPPCLRGRRRCPACTASP